MASCVSIDILPNEILSHVLGFLDVAPPSASTSALRDEPHFGVTQADDAPLKAASCVKKLWRLAALPLLFKHTQYTATEERCQKSNLTDQMQPFLSFLTNYRLGKGVSSFTFISKIRTASQLREGPWRQGGVTDFWHTLYSVIDPSVLLIVAPPQILGLLTSCEIYYMDEWAFDWECHYLRLEQPTKRSSIAIGDSFATRSLTEPTGSLGTSVSNTAVPTLDRISLRPKRRPILFKLREWSKLLLNEGSFIRAYATYEWWLRQPPSIMGSLVGGVTAVDGYKPLFSPSIRDFSYIGIFPMNIHFAAITIEFPRLDKLYVQIVPRNDILQDKNKMRQVEAEDLWMERNSCYFLLMRQLFMSPPTRNMSKLQVFESGDPADKASWELAAEHVKRAGNGWTVVGDGVFVRDPNFKREGGAEDEENEFGVFRKALTRWAWNGTTTLPVTPISHYRHL